MAQRSILSMFKKSNDRLGNPVQDKNRLGQPVQTDTIRRLGKPTDVLLESRIGDPILNTNYETELLVLSESRGGDPAFNNESASTDLSSESRSGDPTLNYGTKSTESASKSRSGDPTLNESGSGTRNAFSVMKSHTAQPNPPKTRKRKRSWEDSSDHVTKTAKVDACKVWQDKWLEEFRWLKYENGAMFCSICMLHKNKSKFSQNGSTNFRVSTLHEHETSSGHLHALKLGSDIQSKRIPSIKTCVAKETDEIEAAVCRLIRIAYEVAVDDLLITKYANLCTLQICNDTKLTTNLYQDSVACDEFISLISRHLDDGLIEKIRQSPALGIMIDESTDLSMEKHLIVYVNYLEKGVLYTRFLTIIKLTAADASVVYNSLVSYLRVCKIDVSKIFGFSSDGAAVMTGKKHGVTTRLLSDNPFMLSMHCVAHKLALSCIDATKSVKEVSYYEGMPHAIHSHFSRSSKRIEHLRVWQDVLEDPQVKPLSVHQIRWLSFANCVTNVRRTLPSLLTTLHSDCEDDPMAESLFIAMSSYKFLYLTHFFSDIMSDIAMLSRKFQERDLNYEDLKKTLVATCDSIEQQYLVEHPSLGQTLREFVDRYAEADTYHDFEIRRSYRDTRLPEVVSEFATSILESIHNRFPKLEIWDALSIFHPDTFPNSVKTKAKFGVEKLIVLVDHFGEKRGSNTPPVNPDDAKREWSLFKNHMFANLEGSSEDDGPVTVSSLAEDMLSSKQMLREFPNMTKLLAISRVLPVSSVECERGFSKQNLIKTRLRCSLTIESLERLMRISINGPRLEDFDPLPIFRMWRSRGGSNAKGRHVFKNTKKQDKLIEQT